MEQHCLKDINASEDNIYVYIDLCKLTEEGKEITVYDKDTKKPLWENFDSGEDCIESFFYRLDLNYKSATTLTEFTSIWAPNTALYPHQAEDYAISLYEAMTRISNL